jgi:GT2 family glycosyltransferase
MVSELVFVVGPDHHPRLVHLAEALAEEVRILEIGATIDRESLPAHRPGRVPVILDPGRLRAGRRRRPPSNRAVQGAVLVHAGLDRGRRTLRRNRSPAFELDLESSRRRRARGEPVAHLPIGWSPRWALPGGGERDVDLAVIGADGDRQFRLLAQAAAELSRLRVHISAAADPRAPDGGPSGYQTAAERRAVLGRAKVLVDLARRGGPRLDALRAAEAICAGAVLVRERSGALDPLQPGRDYIDAQGDPIGAALALLDDPRRLLELQAAAAEALMRIPLRSAAETLLAAADALPAARPSRSLALAGGGEPRVTSPPPVTTDPDSAAARRGLKRVRLAEIELGRELERLAVQLDGGRQEPRVELESPAAADAEPRVSVLVTLFDYEREIQCALSSVAASQFQSLELVIVDDASRDASRERAAEWIESHPALPARLVVHPANLGLPSARNTAWTHARGELAFILDADNRVLPHGLGRLVEALDSDPGAAMAYGLAARVDESGRALGLMNVGAWDPSRLRFTNYIDAMAMIRTDALRELGGYTTELMLYGWEDYDLWCRMAERGMRGAHVPEILAAYRSSYSGMAWSVSNISTTDAYRALIERAPRLMAGVEPPR